MPLLQEPGPDRSTPDERTNPLSLLLPSALHVFAQSPAPPAASALPTQKSCPPAPLSLPSATPPRFPPALSPSLPAVPHIPSLRRLPLPAPAMTSDPASRSPSMAFSPSAHTPPAPCTPATVPINTLATAPLPLPLAPDRPPVSWCSTPPAAYRPAYLHAPAPLLPAPLHARSAAPQSRPTQSGIPGS